MNSQKAILGQKLVIKTSNTAMQRKIRNIIKPLPNLIFFIQLNFNYSLGLKGSQVFFQGRAGYGKYSQQLRHNFRIRQYKTELTLTNATISF